MEWGFLPLSQNGPRGLRRKQKFGCFVSQGGKLNRAEGRGTPQLFPTARDFPRDLPEALAKRSIPDVPSSRKITAVEEHHPKTKQSHKASGSKRPRGCLERDLDPFGMEMGVSTPWLCPGRVWLGAMAEPQELFFLKSWSFLGYLEEKFQAPVPGVKPSSPSGHR